MSKTTPKRLAQKRRHARVRKRVSGAVERPRMSIYRSLNHIYAQVINDEEGRTLVSASTLDMEAKSQVVGKNKTEQAKIVGKLVAERALNAGITQVVFDRGGFIYHGRVKALADVSREAGLKF